VPRFDSLPGSGIALAGDDPLIAVDALRVARRAVRRVERVLTATVAVHLVALPLAATGLLPPLVAAAVAAAWPAVAVASAAALRRVRPAERSAA
jgi:Cu+-exporting ATPase